jgi:hypothetical protein
MAAPLIAVLAASALVSVASSNVAQNRASDAMPSAKAAMVQAAPAKAVGAACFVPVAHGKPLSLAKFSKAKAAGACANAQLAGAPAGAIAGGSGKVLLIAGVVTEAAIIGIGANCTSSTSSC